MWGFLCLPSFPKCHGLISHLLGSPSVFCQGISLWAWSKQNQKEKKPVICFLSFGRYLRIPLAGRGTAELAIIQFYFCYVEFCTFWTFPTVSLPALGYLGWMDTVLGSSRCPCWMSRAPLHPQQPVGSLFNSASVRGSWNFFKPHPLPAASLNTSAERQEEKRRGENITLQGVVIGIIKLAECPFIYISNCPVWSPGISGSSVLIHVDNICANSLGSFVFSLCGGWTGNLNE